MNLETVRKKRPPGIKQSHKKLAWDAREFVAWDGEGTTPATGKVVPMLLPTIEEMKACKEPWKLERYLDDDVPAPQPYVLLANSTGSYIANECGLSTDHCLKFILETKELRPNAIFVGFAFNYDCAQILKDLPQSRLEEIYKTNTTYYRNYRIEWRPRKWLTVTHRPSRKSATIYDVFGFFQSSFITACEKYFGETDPSLELIHVGKGARSTFTWGELEDLILPYCRLELSLLVRLMEAVREDFHNVGLDLSKWYGPGAVANTLFKKQAIGQYMNREIPSDVNIAAQHAYAGGRFEQFRLGTHPDRVYEYDIRSAYPAAIAQLPDLSAGIWEPVDTFEPEAFGVYYIEFEAGTGRTNMPQPLFCRAKTGNVSFPEQTSGWYWAPEAALVPEHIQHGFVWRGTKTEKPFVFVPEIYAQRQDYKSRKVSTERALKLILNSLYGKMAQSVGGKDGPPTWHQIEWAGWVTSYVRALIYNAILLDPEAIIATETDAVFSTRPLPLELSTELGKWELTVFDTITYLQSGFYYATQGDSVICKYRGMDRDRATQQPVGLPYRKVLDHLSHPGTSEYWRTAPLLSSTTRFVNIGLSLCTNSIFRTWETKDKRVSIDQRPGSSKRYHLECIECKQGWTLAEKLHPMAIGGYSGPSHPHPLPWVIGTDAEYLENLEMELAFLWQDD